MSGNNAEVNSNEFQSSYDTAGGVASLEHGYGYNNQVSSGGSLQAQSGGSAKTSFFANPSQSRYEDLKQMLESSKELLKLEAMKRIITMVAKGRSAESARELFPHVVKNVVTKNTELKKLVYLYLTRYAEQEQDLALLSIATFQHALKDPNPLIRGSAIRVLSSIRVPMISPIMLIAIKDCANDMSPYVRKTAAHAIPKLVSLDPEIKEEVVDIIGKLLADKVSLVLGSAVAAFEEVCPDRFDLIHANYRKLCSLLVDVDEWGQIIIINMLIRYTRTQFINPNQPGSSMAKVDQDHLLLVRSVKPLLQSRNSGVVLAVIQLYLSVAPHFELSAQLIRPLIRLLHSHHEIQLIILKNIVTLTSQEFNQQYLGNAEDKRKPDETATNGSNGSRVANKTVINSDSEDSSDDESEDVAPRLMTNRTIRSLFEPYLKSFFVKANDSTQIKILKLEILTNLSNSGNISLILREFQAYIQNYQEDLEFMFATIESIGQCASRINEIAPICLNGLVSLLSNRNESIVAQSIVVIRTQIINKDHSIISHIIRQIVKLMEKISMPQARATIAWIVAEFCARNEYASKVAPDVLRVIAKSFTNENDLVKLQALNLAAKLYLTKVENNTEETSQERLKLLINYIFNLAKYDLNYDVRDRGRFLRQLINDREIAKKVLLVPKLVPNVNQRAERFVYQDVLQPTLNSSATKLANSVDSARFRIGTLSHFLGKKASEYEELPEWPQVQPDPTVRRVKTLEPLNQPKVHLAAGKVDAQPKNGFLGVDTSEEEDEEDEEEEEEDSEEEDEDEEVEEEEVDDEDDDENDNEESEELDEDEEEDDSEDDDVDESEEELVEVKKTAIKKQHQCTKESIPAMDFLLDLSDLTLNEPNSISTSTSSALHQPLLPMTGSSQTTNPTEPYRILESPELVTYREFSLIEVPYQYRVSYRFPRINEGHRTLVELVIKNELLCEAEESTNNRIMIQTLSHDAVLFKNVEAQDNIATISLQPGETRLVTLSVDFNESASLGIELQFNRSQTVKLVAPLGDILYPVRFSTLEAFQLQRAKLTGMNEVIATFDLSIKPTATQLSQILLTLANLCTNGHLAQTEPNLILYYSACTLKFKSFILVTLELSEESAEKVSLKSTINCEKMVLGSMLSKFIKDECTKQFH